MPFRSVAQEALARWRAATRIMETTDTASDAWRAAMLDAERARADYQQAVDDAIRERQPIPIPFDEASQPEAGSDR